MMRAYRIGKSQYIDDLTGEGARIHGGRWNKKNTPMVYLGATPSVALVEFLLHIPVAAFPTDTSIAIISLPNHSMIELTSKKLPAFWADFPFPEEVAAIGTDWILGGETLCMIVPSAISPDDFNILLNPTHPDIKKVKIEEIKDYQINSRLLRS